MLKGTWRRGWGREWVWEGGLGERVDGKRIRADGERVAGERRGGLRGRKDGRDTRGRREGHPVNLRWGCGQGILERKFPSPSQFLFVPFGPT